MLLGDRALAQHAEALGLILHMVKHKTRHKILDKP